MLDQLSPVAPARVRVVLLPIGQIKRARFLSFFERLRPENVVQLGDISPDGRPHRNMFSPLAFPTGKIVYQLTTFYPPAPHIALSPFEQFREPLVIVALADGSELDHISYRGHARRSWNQNANGPPKPEHNLRELHQDLEDLKDQYPKALVHKLMLFDYVHKSADSLPEEFIVVPPPESCKLTTMKTIMCDLSSMLLAEMTTLAKSWQVLNTIESPVYSTSSNQNSNSAWQGGMDESSRRNSQFSPPSQDSRSGSPAGSTDRSYVRMSMPAQLRRVDSNASSPLGRPSSPIHTVQHSATTFEEIVGHSAGDLRNPAKNAPSRLAASESTRETSRERVSVQGFGSNSVSERTRNKGKGRIGIVIGALYLQAGRWGDALKELTDATTIAKVNLDHLWHAKGLDNIVVGMLMLAWAGLDFQIPSLCYASADKTSSHSTTADGKSSASNRLASLQNLTALLPELLDRILNLYTRAANNTGEALPQYPFSESVLRFSRLLSAIHLAGGVLDDAVLDFLVLGTPLSTKSNIRPPRLAIHPPRTEIVTTLFRGLPTSPSPESLSTVDRITVLSGIASVLGSLGYSRKKAMIIRELVSVLIPALVQARIKGAAEMGVHPAAGLAALSAANGTANSIRTLDLDDEDVENGLDVFLGLLSETYGVVSRLHSEQANDSDEAIIASIIENATLRAFGGQNLKMDVLRSCINLSEALPDFQGVLRFTSDLLRTAGSGIAPGPRSDSASPAMTRDEQIRLATNISRTIGAAGNLGISGIAAEYWDEFLVRGVELDAPATTRTPIPHRRSEIPGAAAVAESREVNPFIYNPFLRQPDSSVQQRLLVTGELSHFKVTLQNPYEFDVDIESIKLEVKDIAFNAVPQKTVIGPYRTQILSVSGTPMEPGQMRIVGCIVKVRGCRERRFPIFLDSWSPQSETKIKSIGVAVLSKLDKHFSSEVHSRSLLPMKPPTVSSLSLNVIDKQPVVIIKSSTLSQSAVMVLEGERQTFSITLQNLSKDTPVDLLLFSFKDSTQTPLQAAMKNREASAAELYECELIFARKQALRWKKKSDERPYIAPGATAVFDIEVLGRPGLTSAFVQIDYAHMGVSPENYQENFHTRQVSLPLTITVNASIELARMDVLPLTGTIPSSLWPSRGGDREVISPEEYCLLVLDLRNAWPSSLQIHLDVSDGSSIDDEILPGNTSRIMLPIRRIFLDDPSAAIPSLDPSRQRQFVVSASRISADTERFSREAFWYREELLKMLQGTWKTKTGPPRTGDMELRGIRLSQRMIEAIKIDDVEVRIRPLDVSGAMVSELSVDSLSAIQVAIHNRADKPILPVLRVQPAVRNQSHGVALDLSKKFVWNGILQQTLPLLDAGMSTEVTLGITPLCRGEFEVGASVEEGRIFGEQQEDKSENKRPRANTGTIMDALLGVKERRIWHTREPCLIVVKDKDDSDSEDSD